MGTRYTMRSVKTVGAEHRWRPDVSEMRVLASLLCAACWGCAGAVWLAGCGDRDGGGSTTQPAGPASAKPPTSAPTTQPAGAGGAERAATKPAATAPAAVPAAMVELDLGLTIDAVTRATPGYTKGIRPPHLREEVKRKAFYVPEGTENVALYTHVSSSEKDTVLGDLDQITDGIKKSEVFEIVDLGVGPRWAQVDLGRMREIHAVAIWHFYKNATIYNDVIVQVADDEACARNVRTLFNNDHDNSAGMGKGTDTAFYTRWWGELVSGRDAEGTPVRGRYVRVHTAAGVGGESVRFVEIDVYGK